MPDKPKGQGPGRGELNPQERAEFEHRSAALGDKLGKAKAVQSAGSTSGDALHGKGMAYGFRMASELVGAIVVGGLIGYGLDWWLGTTPWLFLVFFLLGFVAGVMNVLRAYERVQQEIKAKTGGNIGTSVRDED